MDSSIFRGKVSHTRLHPHYHHFDYTLYMMYLDLTELPELFDSHLLWSARRPAVAWFRRQDHYGKPEIPLDEAIMTLIKQETGKEYSGRIHLLTHLRYFGFCMNPVSFYYCWDDSGKTLQFIVGEVHNTPWNETHCYVLDCNTTEPVQGEYRFSFPKRFHVSPFMPMNQHYAWSFSVPAQGLHVRMDNYEDGTRKFNASMALARSPVTGRNLVHVLLAYPLMTLKVIMAIYWQAWKLWLKKTPFFPHPKHPDKKARP